MQSTSGLEKKPPSIGSTEAPSNTNPREISIGGVSPLPSAEPPSQIPLATHHFPQRYLYAFATQGEVINHVRTQAVVEESHRLSEILLGWELLQPRVTALMEKEIGRANIHSLQPIPEEYRALLDALTGDMLFQKSFLHVPTGFALVNIDDLVAPQRTVNLDYVDRLVKRFPPAPTFADLFDICLSSKRHIDPIQHLEVGPNAHVFSSPNSDIRFLGAFVKELSSEDLSYAELGGLPAAAIIAFVGYGAAPVNVLHAGGRVILNNGFHRVFALRSMGVKQIPVVVQQIRNPQLEFPPHVSGLSREYLLSHPRPVLMRDFFEPDFAITLKVRERLKTVNINVATNQYEVPS